MNTKNNKRFKDMDIKLQATLLRLMNTIDFDKITVTLICQTAQVNRSTFYAHFLDIYDMMEHMENYLSQELLLTYENLSASDADILSSNPFLPLLQHIRKHRYFYKTALQQGHILPLQQGYDSLLDQIIKTASSSDAPLQENVQTYYRIFLHSGLSSTLRCWIENDCREPEEDMQKMFINWIF